MTDTLMTRARVEAGASGCPATVPVAGQGLPGAAGLSWFCTGPLGHPGRHTAENVPGDVLAAWWDEDVEA